MLQENQIKAVSLAMKWTEEDGWLAETNVSWKQVSCFA